MSDLTDSVRFQRGEPAADSLPPPLPPPEAPRSRNYFMRHWRGELSLPVSYWVNGTLSSLAIGLTVGLLAYATHREGGDAQPLLWLASLIFTWVLGAALTVWQAVGIWRSATRYRRGGKHFWGGAAQVLTVLGAVQFVASFATVGAPQLAGIYEIVSGDARVGPHQFRIIANGQTLEFSGGITFGVARELEGFLNAMTNVRTVRLNSIGGRILEAQKMSDIIRRKNLATFIASKCLSACTIVFLGGVQRFMLPTAQLGFHQPTFRGMTVTDRRAAISGEVARLQRLGLSLAFAVKANSATPDTMWYPDKDELIREHVVTRLISPKQIWPSPTDGPIPGVSPDQRGAPVVSAAPLAPAPTPSASSVPAGGDPAFETGRAKIPADVLKRITTVPIRKPAVISQPPPAQAAAPAPAPALAPTPAPAENK